MTAHARIKDGETFFVPLNKLKKSPKNVRTVPHPKADIKALAASIGSRGLLQNLVVEPECDDKGRKTGAYLVTIGEGRRLAQLLRAKRKEIKASEPIRCVLDMGDNPQESSLAENVLRTPMHPADEYEAFAKLHSEQNMPAADIAARFGVSEAVVKQRLKLGSVSPRLIKLYRNGEMTLDQLTAFTITDDHKAQERVWKELPEFNNDRSAILEALTETQVPADDRRALFVGAETYEQAGGAIIRDLFDAEGGGYFTNRELLNRLVREKLQRAAKKVMGEGWKWVSIDADFDHGAAAQMRRVHARLSPENQAKREALEAKRDALWQSQDDDQDGEVEMEAIDAEIEALDKSEKYDPADIARAGAFVCLGQKGRPRIESGYLRKEDDLADTASSPDDKSSENGEPQEARPKGLSDKLVSELTAARTSALRNELGRSPTAALAAMTHALVVRLFYQTEQATCLLVSARQAPLHTHAPAVMEGEAEKAIATRHAAWQKLLPDDLDKLWDCIAAMAQADQLDLLAHCAGLTVDAVHDARTVSCAPADTLARAVSLDMTRYWQPTATSYFSRVSKDRIAEAVAEAISAEAATNLADMKKGAMAEAAARRLADKGWLPEVLRTP